MEEGKIFNPFFVFKPRFQPNRGCFLLPALGTGFEYHIY